MSEILHQTPATSEIGIEPSTADAAASDLTGSFFNAISPEVVIDEKFLHAVERSVGKTPRASEVVMGLCEGLGMVVAAETVPMLQHNIEHIQHVVTNYEPTEEAPVPFELLEHQHHLEQYIRARSLARQIIDTIAEEYYQVYYDPGQTRRDADRIEEELYDKLEMYLDSYLDGKTPTLLLAAQRYAERSHEPIDRDAEQIIRLILVDGFEVQDDDTSAANNSDMQT